MASVLLTAVRFLHYTAGIAWVGASLVLAVVVFPAIDRCPGQVRGPVMRAITTRIAPWEIGSSLAVIATGLAQVGLQHRFDAGIGGLLESRWGQAIGVGLLCAIAILFLGYHALAPLALRFTAMEEEVSADPVRSAMGIRELGRHDPGWWDVRRRLVAATALEILLALIAVASMAVARGS